MTENPTSGTGEALPARSMAEARILIGNLVDDFFLLERVGALFRKLEDDLAGGPERFDKDTRSVVLHGIDALSERIEALGKRLGDLEFWEMGRPDKYSDVTRAALTNPKGS